MIKKILSFVLIVCISTINSYAFGSTSHFNLTWTAIINTKLLDKFELKDRLDIRDVLLQSCNFPDEKERDYMFYKHFYDPAECFEGLNGGNNAMNLMNCHYKEAKKNWEIDRNKSLKELGCAIHYLQDMCCVAHEVSWFENLLYVAILFLKHQLYEKAVDEYFKTNFYTLIEKYKDFDFRKNTIDINGTVIGYAHYLKSTFKSKYQWSILHEIDIDEVGTAHQATCKLIYLFFKEVGIEL